VTLTDLVEHLEESGEYKAQLPMVKAYRNRYGVAIEG